MDIPQLTPQRQKLLMGAAAASLLVVLGFSVAPELELADQEGAKEVDDAMAIIEDEHATSSLQEKATARALRRARPSSVAEQSASSTEAVVQRPAMIAERPARALTDADSVRGSQVIPPSYQERLAVLAEEEASLLRHHRRQTAGSAATDVSTPMPTVSRASVETADGGNGGVEHALAQARRPGRLRRVELTFGESESMPASSASTTRGAWLSGKIEIE